MLDDATMAIITGAAGNVAAYMLNGHADALRAWVSKIFRGEPDAQQSSALEALDVDRAAILDGTVHEADVKTRWSVLLTSLLVQHPELREEIKAMSTAPLPTTTVNVGSQHNHGPGTFIGGSNYGPISAAATRGSE